MRPRNGGRPPGPTSPGRPNVLMQGAATREERAMHNGTRGLRAQAKGLPCCREGIAPKPQNAVIPLPYQLRNQDGYD